MSENMNSLLLTVVTNLINLILTEKSHFRQRHGTMDLFDT